MLDYLRKDQSNSDTANFLRGRYDLDLKKNENA